MNFVGNLLLFAAVKELCKSINNKGGTLFWLTVYFRSRWSFASSHCKWWRR